MVEELPLVVSRGAAMQGAKENIRKKSREDKRRQGGGLSATRNAGKLSPFPPPPRDGQWRLGKFYVGQIQSNYLGRGNLTGESSPSRLACEQTCMRHSLD